MRCNISPGLVLGSMVLGKLPAAWLCSVLGVFANADFTLPWAQPEKGCDAISSLLRAVLADQNLPRELYCVSCCHTNKT